MLRLLSTWKKGVGFFVGPTAATAMLHLLLYGGEEKKTPRFHLSSCYFGSVASSWKPFLNSRDSCNLLPPGGTAGVSFAETPVSMNYLRILGGSWGLPPSMPCRGAKEWPRGSKAELSQALPLRNKR